MRPVRPQFIQGTVMTDSQRLSAGTYNQLSRDVQDHTVYDTLCFSTSLQRQSFFVDGIGKTLAGTAITKSLAHTNLKSSGSRLPAGYQFLIKGITINAVRRVLADHTEINFAGSVIRVLQASNFRIVFPGRDFDLEIPGDTFLPTIAAIDQVSVQTPNLGVAVASSGSFLANKMLPLRNQLVIGQIGGAPVDFSVEWFVDNQDSGVSTALTALTTTSADALKLGLVGTLEKLK